MYHPARKREAMGDDPPFLTMGTEVSAKYKGAFCEAKVRKVVRSVKCRVTFKLGLGTAIVTDDQIKGVLRAGASVEVKHPDKKEFVEATITKIQDCSQYTVVFDDGDITTLRRTALCLKSGRHFAESETLDQLPLTHPEHFSNPVIGGRRGRRNRHAQDESSDEEEAPKKDKKKSEKEADIGKVVCVELGDKKKQKDNWFPGLVVAPTAQDTVRIRVKDDYLVRSFKDGRYYTVPKKEATAFTREIGSKVDNNTLKTAVEKALLFLDKDELPPHWDRELLFSVGDNSESDLDAESDIESSDDERQEEKDHFVAQLYKFMDDCGTPINKGPTIFDEDLDLYRLFKVVHKLGGYNRVTNHNQWKFVTSKLGLKSLTQTTANHVKQSYKKYLHNFEDFYRKLGCTMVNHPRGSRARHRSGRSLIRDRDRATPVSTTKISDKEKPSTSTGSTAGPSVVPAKKAEPEEEKKKPAKQKEEKPKVKEEKKEPAVASTSSAPPAPAPVEDTKPRREIKVRSERLKMKVEKLKTWREESQSEEEEEASSTSGGSQPVTVEPSAGSPETDSDNEEQEDEDDEEEEEKPTGKPLERERRRPPAERKADEEEKTLRLRSKGGRSTPERARTRDARTPVREMEKKQAGTRSKTAREEESSNNPNPPHPPPQQPKKRGRKRKDSEKSRTGEEAGRLPLDVQVQLGDKLKVYYGQETKTTYEAKVIEIEEESSPNMFLVHYTGWNTRYDEWIPRTRIEENLSWTPARAKRSKLQQQQQQQQQQSSSSQQPQGTQVLKSSRGRPVSGRGQEGAPPLHSTRSTTPSSVTSSSSRTKSPAQSSHNTRAQRAASRLEQTQSSSQQGSSSGVEFRRRPRRISGHADFLINVTESESESSESETEIEPMGLRRRRTRQDSESSARVEAPETRRPERLTKRQPVRKDRSEEEEEETEERDVGDSDSQSQTRSRKGRRTRRVTESERKEEEQRQQQEQPPTKVEEEQPKGRDFDLNQIRSELKGFDKAVKSPIEIVPSDTDTDIPVATAVKPEPTTAAVDDVPSTSTETVDKKEVVSSTPPSSKKAAAAATPDSKKDDTDDIYEFKEPEPFEFEVRSKRDSTLAEERSKLSKRPIRLFDDLPEAKTPPKKKSPKKETKTAKVEETTPESDTRRRRRLPLRRQDDDDEESESSKPSTSKESPSPSGKAQQKSAASPDSFKKLYDSTVFDKAKPESQQQKSDALTASEEVFKKIYASTTFPVLEAPARRSPRPLDLFADLPAGPDDDGDEGDDEGEDRLIISEPDTEPLFSYPQRHEEMLPTPTSRVSPEPGKSLFDFSGAGSSGSSSAKKSEVAKLMVHKAEGEEGTLTHVERPVPMHDDVIKLLLKEDEDDEEDSINAAIQRVIAQSIHEDDDIDLLPKVMPELEPKPKASPKLPAATPPAKSMISPKPTPKLVPVSDTPKVQTPKVEATTSKQAASKVTTPEVKTKTSESTKVVPKVAEETSKTTPKPSAESAIKTTSKPMPSLESITKIPPKSPLSVESPVKAMPKLVQTPEVTEKNTPKPALTADFTSKFATTYAKTPQATPEPLAKPSSSKVIQSPEQTPGKLTTRNSPSIEKSSLKPSEAAKVTPKSIPQTESPSTSQSDATVKVSAKITSPPEPFVKSSAKVTPETYKFGSKLASALDPKSTPKSSTVSDVSKSLPSTPKSSVIPLKTSASIAKSTLAAADSAMSKLSSKSAHSVDVPSKASPKTSLPEVSKTPASKSIPSTPEVFSRTKSPPVAEASKAKATPPEITPSKSGPSKPSESISKPPSAKVTPQFPLKESLKREAKKEPRKKALKKTVSKEFVEDTSSDSDSDTGMKLVIDKLEEESISDSIGSDKKEDTRKESLGKAGFAKKPESEPRSILEKKLEACASEMEQRKRKKEDSEPTSSKKSRTEASKNVQEEEEADSSLNSLLCEETIPGSPPPVEAPQPVCPDTPKVREIPFASMPAGGNGASTSATPQQPPKPFSLRDEKPETSAASRTPAAGAAAQPPQPAAAPAAAGSRKEDEAAPVMDNTPPTTPDSSISTISGSPREDRAGSSPHRDESGKSVRDSSEVDLDSPADANKGDPFSEDSLLNVEVSSSCEATSTLRPKTTPKRSEQEKEPMDSPKKRRRTANKKEDTPLLKRTRHSSGRSPRNIGAGSDSDDNSENSNPVNMSSLTSADNLLANRSPRPSKYNFYVELDPELDGSQRIALLQHKLQELRKTYLEVKAELACIDRRRKKLRRREREASKAAAAAKQEVWCA